jgi:hypothetical protein
LQEIRQGVPLASLQGEGERGWIGREAWRTDLFVLFSFFFMI